MSVHYSRYNLNTYYNTPYFQAHVPQDYPLDEVLRKSRAFQRLPPRLRELSALAKQWAVLKLGYPTDTTDYGYDEEGHELDLTTKKRLTNKEIDAQWKGIDEGPSDFEVEDIPVPDGGFADPDTWDVPIEEEDLDEDVDVMTEEQVLSDIKERGREYTARYYGVPEESLVDIEDDEGLAQTILNMRG